MNDLIKPLLTIFIVTLITRLVLINHFPIGMTHDELNYVIAAKSIIQTGKFAPGTAPAILPTSMKNYDVVIAEVPAYIFAVFESMGLSARMAGGLFSALGASTLFMLVYKLLKDKRLALISALIFIISPWNFLMGRSAFETNFIVFFYLASLVCLFVLKGKKLLFSLIPLSLGFFSYTGGQVSFYLFTVVGLVFAYLKNKPEKKYYTYLLITISLIFLLYLFRVSTSQSFSSRGQELYLPTSPQVTQEVDSQRLLSVPSFWTNIYVNKLTVWSKQAIEKYFGAFSVDRLFLNGELRAAFSLQTHGNFYIIDFIFLILGVSYLYKKSKTNWWFFALLIAVSPITSAISTVEFSYTQRAALMYPFIIIFIAVGIQMTIKRSPLKKITPLTIYAIYVVLISNMLFVYFDRFPVYASDGWFFQDKVLARYIELTRDTQKNNIVVVSNEPKIIFEEYLHFADLYKGGNIKIVNKNLDEKNYSFENIVFIKSCPDLNSDDILIFDPEVDCNTPDNTKPIRITRHRDVAEKYLIYNDTICSKYALSTYVHPSAYNSFDTRNQTEEDFCLSWITKI